MSGTLDVIREQLAHATAAKKCHTCGCLHQTVAAFEATEPARTTLATTLVASRRAFGPKKYDCLGCAVCYPANAANAFAEAYPSASVTMDLCPTTAPQARDGWPPLPGDYRVLRYGAAVAVCTLNDAQLATELAHAAPAGLAIVGTMHTENLGIERLIKNTLANPHIRRLVLCGADTRQAIGHLPGQSLQSLFARGLDDSGRIRGANGKRPVLRNVTREVGPYRSSRAQRSSPALVCGCRRVSAAGLSKATADLARVSPLLSARLRVSGRYNFDGATAPGTA